MSKRLFIVTLMVTCKLERYRQWTPSSAQFRFNFKFRFNLFSLIRQSN